MRRTSVLYPVLGLFCAVTFTAAVDLSHQAADLLGLTLTREAGAVVVTGLAPDSPAFAAGIRKGDRIVGVDGVDTSSDDPEQILARLLTPRGDAIRLVLARERGGRQEILLRRPEGVGPAPSPRAALSLTGPPGTRPPIPGPHSTGRPEVLRRAGVAVGDHFINFTLPRLGGGELTLEDLAGKPIYLDFWATWCGPCRSETPALAIIHRVFGDEVQMVGISLDQRPAAPIRYVTDHGITYPQLIGDLRDPALQAYGVHRTGIPLSVLIDADGTVVGVDLHGEPLARAIETMLGRPHPGRP